MGSDPFDNSYKSCICGDCGCGCARSPGCQAAMRWVIFGFLLTATIFSYVATAGCQFLLYGTTDISIKDYDRYGLFRNYASDPSNNDRLGCIAYTEEFKELEDSLWKDGAFQAGQAFSIITTMIVTTAFFLNFTQIFFAGCGRNILWHVTQYLVLISIITNVCQFSAFGSELCVDTPDFVSTSFGCVVGASSILASLNTFILLTTCILLFAAPPPPQPVCMVRPRMGNEGNNEVAQAVPTSRAVSKTTDPEEDDVEVEPAKPGSKIDVMIVNNPDGTRTSTRTVTNPDGSKSITRTIEKVDEEEEEGA